MAVIHDTTRKRQLNLFGQAPKNAHNPNRINRIGFKYGLLTVIAAGPDKYRKTSRGTEREPTWIAKCQCGKITKPLRVSDLHQFTSCGCRHHKNKYDFTGHRFGGLAVLRRGPNHPRSGSKTWICRCDCGRETVVESRAFVWDKTTSCGCQGFSPTDSAFNVLFSRYKREARRRGYRFELTRETFETLTKRPCYYCGAEPNQKQRTTASKVSGTRLRPYIYNGIDRKDITLDYTIHNSVPCCGRCNLMKHTSDWKSFISQCHAITRLHPQI